MTWCLAVGLFIQAAFVTSLIAVEENTRADRIVWQPDLSVKLTEKIIPSPHDPRRVLVATREGLAQTMDGAKTWSLIPNTGRDTLGRVSDIIFSPFDENRLFLGSKDKGVFRSEDGGKTWQNIGTVETGLISPRVIQLACHPGDRRMGTLYACHGNDVAGLSKSIDGGKSWFKISERYNVSLILLHGSEFIMCGRLVEEPDVWSVFSSKDGGQYWKESARNVRMGAATSSRLVQPEKWYGVPPAKEWFGVQGGRILQSASWELCGPEQPGDWQSIFCTFGNSSEEEVVYAYDPHGQGLVASKDGFATCLTENDGLFIDRLIKEGAHVCAPAGGAAFFASINGQLYVGRRSFPDAPAISEPKATPSIVRVPHHAYLEAMSEVRTSLRDLAESKHAGRVAVRIHDSVRELSQWSLNLNVQLSIRVAASSAERKISSVEINLAPLLGPAKAELFDDGKHGDAAAGDGVYELIFPISPRCLDHYAPQSRGPRPPGQTALTVTASEGNGRTSNAVLLLSIYPRGESMVFWNGDAIRWGINMSHQGDCEMAESEAEPRSGKRGLRVTARSGPWSCGWGMDYRGKNVSEEDVLTFWIKAPEAPGRDIKVSLQDASLGETVNFSDEVWLIKDGFLKARSNTFQQVKIPMVRLFSKTGFQLDRCGGIVFGGAHPDGDEFYVDDIGFEVKGDPDGK